MGILNSYNSCKIHYFQTNYPSLTEQTKNVMYITWTVQSNCYRR